MSRLASSLHSRCTTRTNATSWRAGVALGVGISLFLYLLQPSGISQYRGNAFLMCPGFGAITISVQWLYAFLFFERPLRKNIPIANGYIILYNIAIELAIVISMTFYAASLFQMLLTWRLFSIFFYWTLFVQVVATAIFTLISYNRILNSRLEEIARRTTDEQEDIPIALRDQNLRGADPTLSINNLLYIEARKSNVCVCYLKEGKIQEIGLRSTLIALKDNLSYDSIFQCRRSFLVDINNISSAKGDSSGYQLRLSGCDDFILVPHAFVPGLRHLVGQYLSTSMFFCFLQIVHSLINRYL